MTDTEAVTLTDDEREQLQVATALIGWATAAEAGAELVETVESILAARLAGAGAQVTEAAVEAAAEAIHYITPTGAQHEAARAALSAALPHMGTGQSETDLRARISALADEWQNLAIKWPYAIWANQNVDHANRLRALLDRPAASEGNET